MVAHMIAYYMQDSAYTRELRTRKKSLCVSGEKHWPRLAKLLSQADLRSRSICADKQEKGTSLRRL